MASEAAVCRGPQTEGVIERFFGTLKYEHLFRGLIADAGALAVEVQRFQIYNTIRPRQALGDRTPRGAYRAGAFLQGAGSAKDGAREEGRELACVVGWAGGPDRVVGGPHTWAA